MLYDYPQYYEIAFSFRDIRQETDFIVSCFKRFSKIPVHRVLEIACGPAPHSGELTQRGYRYLGLDNNRNMLDYAAYKWRHLIPPPTFVEANMVNFELPEPVDFAYVMLGSLYLSGHADLTHHFDGMAGALRPGGLYFLDWCVQFNDPLIPQVASDMTQERDGIKVDSRFKIRLVDSANQMYEEIWTVDVNDHGRQKSFEMVERNRAIFPQEFLLFLENRRDFEFVGWWHEWDLSKPVGGQAFATRPVVIIRRK